MIQLIMSDRNVDVYTEFFAIRPHMKVSYPERGMLRSQYAKFVFDAIQYSDNGGLLYITTDNDLMLIEFRYAIFKGLLKPKDFVLYLMYENPLYYEDDDDDVRDEKEASMVVTFDDHSHWSESYDLPSFINQYGSRLLDII